MNVMIDNLDAIEPRQPRRIDLSSDDIEMLLFDFLQELIYFKDAERLLLRIRSVRIEQRDKKYVLKAEAAGEPLDAERHRQRADVKAVTLHDFSVKKEGGEWKARVLLDI
jgi:SHS2 domain-containing protein